jgi:hypothetical protein
MGVVPVLVDRLDEVVGAARVRRPRFEAEPVRQLGGVDAVEIDVVMERLEIQGGAVAGPVRGVKGVGVAFPQAGGDLEAAALAVRARRRRVISPGHPDDVVERPVPVPEPAAVGAARFRGERLHLHEPALAAAVVAHVGREEENEDAGVPETLEDGVGVGEVGFVRLAEVPRREEGVVAGGVARRVVAVMVLDEVHHGDVDPLRLAVGGIEVGLLERQLDDDRPGGLPVHEEGSSGAVDERPAVVAHPHGKGRGGGPVLLLDVLAGVGIRRVLDGRVAVLARVDIRENIRGVGRVRPHVAVSVRTRLRVVVAGRGGPEDGTAEKKNGKPGMDLHRSPPPAIIPWLPEYGMRPGLSRAVETC